MEATKKHVVYEHNYVLGSDKITLVKVDFKRLSNYFDTEEDAIKALLEQGATFTNYIILTEVYITNFEKQQ